LAERVAVVKKVTARQIFLDYVFAENNEKSTQEALFFLRGGEVVVV
jgi:hypothetical protein